MSIDVTCPGCQKVYPVPEALAGKTIKCKACGEFMDVPAARPAKPVVAKALPATPLPAKSAPRVVVEDEDDPPAKPIRRPRVEMDEPAAAKKKSSLPLVLGGVLGLLVVAGAGVMALYAAGVIGATGPTVASNANPAWTPSPPPQGDPPAPGPTADTEPPPAPVEPEKKTETKSTPPSAIPPRANDPGRPPLLPSIPTQVRPAPAEVKTASPPPPTRDTPDQKTLDRCKLATVLLRVETQRAGGEGTGWFGVEDGLIFTNAHVLFMDTPGSSKPAKITAFVSPGTPQEREVPHQRIEVLAVDRAMDLAVLRVSGEANLPKPLTTRPSAELRELEKLIVLGYPGGRRLSLLNRSAKPPAVTISETKVQAIRRDDDGNMYSVQVSGGIVHGNSGGPITDLDGNVVGVAVRVDLDREHRFTGIAYGVPTEFVTGLLAGRVAEIEYGQAYREGGMIHIPVTAACIDPMNRLKEVGLGVWVGDAPAKDAPRRPRLPGPTRSGVEPADSNFAEVALAYKFDKDKQTATGEFVLPEPPAGRTYWAQPYYSNGLVTKYWLAGNPAKLPGPPVDRVPADLVVKYKPNTKRTLTLSNLFGLDEYAQGEGEEKSERLQLEIGIKGTETVMAAPQGDSTSHAVLRMNYEKLDLAAQEGLQKDQFTIPKELRALITQAVTKGIGYGYVSKNGQIYRSQSDTRALQPPLNQLFHAINNDVMETLGTVSLPLPNGRVEAMHTWKSTHLQQLSLAFLEPGDRSPPPGGTPPKGPRPKGPAKAQKARQYKFSENMTFTYLGTRTRAGTKEGVIKIEGTITAAPGVKSDEGATGQFKGYAYVDLDTGEVVEAEVSKEFEIDTSGEGERKRVSGINTYKLSRGGAVSQ